MQSESQNEADSGQRSFLGLVRLITAVGFIVLILASNLALVPVLFSQPISSFSDRMMGFGFILVACGAVGYGLIALNSFFTKSS